jgi:hypothetical protein
VLEATQIRVELVTRYEPGSDPAGDRLKFAVTDQCTDVVLGAAEFGGNLADRQRCGPLHARSMACGSSTEVLNRAGPPPNGRFVRVHAATLA